MSPGFSGLLLPNFGLGPVRKLKQRTAEAGTLSTRLCGSEATDGALRAPGRVQRKCFDSHGLEDKHGGPLRRPHGNEATEGAQRAPTFLAQQSQET